MTPQEAIKELEYMDKQMIHAKRRIFLEIADVIRGLTADPQLDEPEKSTDAERS